MGSSNKKLIEACLEKAPDFDHIRELTRMGADPNCFRSGAGSVLNQALTENNYRLAKVLLDEGGDPLRDSNASLAMIMWSPVCRALVDEWLTKHRPTPSYAMTGITVLKKPAGGGWVSPEIGLVASVEFRDVGEVKLLLEQGADPLWKNDKGDRAIDIARELQHQFQEVELDTTAIDRIVLLLEYAIDHPTAKREVIEQPLSTTNWEMAQARPEPGEPLRVGMAGVEPPVSTRRIRPERPDGDGLATITGAVIVEVVVKRDGTVEPVRVLRDLAGEPRFGAKALEAVKQWEFLPGKFEGKPVDVVMSLKVDFL